MHKISLKSAGPCYKFDCLELIAPPLPLLKPPHDSTRCTRARPFPPTQPHAAAAPPPAPRSRRAALAMLASGDSDEAPRGMDPSADIGNAATESVGVWGPIMGGVVVGGGAIAVVGTLLHEHAREGPTPVSWR